MRDLLRVSGGWADAAGYVEIKLNVEALNAGCDTHPIASDDQISYLIGPTHPIRPLVVSRTGT